MKSDQLWPFLFAIILCIEPQNVSAQRFIYVDQQATGQNNGTTFDDAYMFLQDALLTAQHGDAILVSAGIYSPDQGSNVVKGDREAAFFLKNGVRILGGFDSGNSLLASRDWQKNVTILSGDLLGNDNENVAHDEPTRSDNSVHVVIAPPETDTTAVLDGFVIRDGHADQTAEGYMSGGGMLVMFGRSSEIRLSNLSFENNFTISYGGGLANHGGPIWLSNVSFLENVALDLGGAVYHRPATEGAFAQFRTAFFSGNKADQGGALYTTSGGLTVTESIFIRNEAYAGGAAMHLNMHPEHNRGAEAIYANVSFLGNRATRYGGVFCNEDESVISVYNGVFSGNQALNSKNSQSVTLGGAIVNVEGSRLTLLQTTMVNNSASKGGAIYMSSGEVSFFNSIIQSNQSDSSGTENFFVYNNSPLTLEHSILDTELPASVIDNGGNQFDTTLLLDERGPDGIAGTLDDDLRLHSNSSAIDAGNNALLLPDLLDLDQDGDTTEPLPFDLDGKERISNGERLGHLVDLGAYEFNAGFPVGIDDKAHYTGTSCPGELLAPAYPNPFSNSTQLTLCVTSPGLAKVYLYDILGRKQAMVFDSFIQAHQPYPIVVNRQNLSSGIYFIRLKHGNINTTQSIILTP